MAENELSKVTMSREWHPTVKFRDSEYFVPPPLSVICTKKMYTCSLVMSWGITSKENFLPLSIYTTFSMFKPGVGEIKVSVLFVVI